MNGVTKSTSESSKPHPKFQPDEMVSERHDEIKREIDSLKDDGERIDVRAIKSALDDGEIYRAEKLLEEKKNNLFKIENIKEEINRLQDEEEMIDVRAVESALENGDIERARKRWGELEENYQEYKETIEELESLDEQKSSLAIQLADEKIDKGTYDDAVQSIEHKKADLEEKLNKSRKKVIHEDYEKPF